MYTYPRNSFNRSEELYNYSQYSDFRILEKITELYKNYLNQTGGTNNNKYNYVLIKKLIMYI